MSEQAEQQELNKEPKLFITTEETLNSTLQYLAGRPYGEVFQLIEALRKSTPQEHPMDKDFSHELTKS